MKLDASVVTPRRVRIVILLLVAILVYSALPDLADWVANGSFGNAIPAPDREPPQTAWAPTWSTAEVGAIIGRGEGLDCSIPPAALSAFASHVPHKDVPLASVNLRFRQACVAHDLCYRHGRATYGYTQSQCDQALAAASFRLCKFFVSGDIGWCAGEARKVLGGVTLGGTDSYRPAAYDKDQLGPSGDMFGRTSTIAEYEPFPQATAQFVLPRMSRGDCLGQPNVPVLVVIKRRPGGYAISRKCFIGDHFVSAPLVPADSTKTTSSEYATEVSMPWLSGAGGLMRRCRDYGGTTNGGFAYAANPLSYSGCDHVEHKTDPDVVTYFPVSGTLAARVAAVGMEETWLRHIDTDAVLPPGVSRGTKVACMNDRANGCSIALPRKICGDAKDADYYRWFATPPLVTPLTLSSGEQASEVTIFARGCGTQSDYQALSSRSILLGSNGWLGGSPEPGFALPRRWALPETAEPFIGVRGETGLRLLSAHAVPVTGLRAKLRMVNILSVAIAVLLVVTTALLLALRRKQALWAVGIAALALSLMGIRHCLTTNIGDGFTNDAEVSLYSPIGEKSVPALRLTAGRSWLQQRIAVVGDDGRELIIMSRFGPASTCAHQPGTCLDVSIVPVTAEGVEPSFVALHAPLPEWATPEWVSKLMLIPFRQADGVLDLLLLGTEDLNIFDHGKVVDTKPSMVVFRSRRLSNGKIIFDQLSST